MKRLIGITGINAAESCFDHQNPSNQNRQVGIFDGLMNMP